MILALVFFFLLLLFLYTLRFLFFWHFMRELDGKKWNPRLQIYISMASWKGEFFHP